MQEIENVLILDSVTWKYKVTLITRPRTVKQKKKKRSEDKRTEGVFSKKRRDGEKEKESKGKEISIKPVS